MAKEKVTQLKNHRTKVCPVCDGFRSIEVVTEKGKVDQDCDYCKSSGRVPIEEDPV